MNQTNRLEVHMFPCLSDNYGFLIHDHTNNLTATIDTPEVTAIEKALNENNWSLTHISTPIITMIMPVGILNSRIKPVVQLSVPQLINQEFLALTNAFNMKRFFNLENIKLKHSILRAIH